MSNVELLEVMMIFTVLWYVGLALAEGTRSMKKKPMATRNKKNDHH